MGRINCFIPFANAEQAAQTIQNLKQQELVNKIYLLATEEGAAAVEGCELVPIKGLTSSATMRAIAERADADYVLYYTKFDTLKMGPFSLERFAKLGDDTCSGMLYAPNCENCASQQHHGQANCVVHYIHFHNLYFF